MHNPTRTQHHPPTTGAQTCDLVIGLGKTGFSCARYLHGLGHRVIVNDSRSAPPLADRLQDELPGLETHLGGFDVTLLAHADRVVVSPGVPLHEPLVAEALKRRIPVIGDIDLFFEQRTAPVAGITGSNGKSTVTTWLCDVLAGAGKRVYAGGNLGTPALELLDAPAPDAYALELSSFQLERSGGLDLDVAALLNVSADHQDHHGSMAQYAAAKARIFERARVAVVHREQRKLVPTGHRHVITFGPDAAAYGHYGLLVRDGRTFLAKGDTTLVATDELALRAGHDHVNALAVLALADALGVGWPAAQAGLLGYTGLPHRMQAIATRNGVTWIDDSKGTNVGATLAAIGSVTPPIVLIAGGDAKGADLTPLAAALATRARAAVLLGKDAEQLATVLAPVCAVHRVDDIAAAVLTAAALAHAGDTVLLSPACSSLDMFAGFAQRGEMFAAAVEALQ